MHRNVCEKYSGQVGENRDRETSLKADYHQTLWMMMIK